MTKENLANGYSSESTHQELSNEYQHDMVKIVFKNICILFLRTKVAIALKGLKVRDIKNQVLRKYYSEVLMPYVIKKSTTQILLCY